MIVFHLVLALEHRLESVSNHSWQSVLRLMTDSLPEQVTPLSWISDLVTSLTNKHGNLMETPHSTNSQSKCDYSVLIDVAKDLFGYFDRQTEKHTVVQDQDHKGLQMKAMSLCCKENLPLFLHLLVTVAGVSVECVIDMEYDTTALHYAARYNNQSAYMYLINHGAVEMSKDKFGNIPSHHAFMYGHKGIDKGYIFPYLNTMGVTPDEIKLFFTHYMKCYRVPTKYEFLDPHDRNDVTKVTNILLGRLLKEWEAKGIASSVQEIHVDFTEGEAFIIMNVINKLIDSLIGKVRLTEPLMEGKHKILGSSGDKVRLYCPDEFDANVVLQNISGYTDDGIQVSITAGNAAQTSSIHLSSEKQEIQHLLEGSNLLDKFYEGIKKCLPKCHIADERLTVMPPGIKRTKVGVELNFVWFGSEFNILHVGVDLVPTIEAPWPDQLPRPKLTPVDLKTVYINSTGDGKWRFSFAHAENMIMMSLTEEQRTVYLVCKMILSKLKPEAWAPRVIRNQYKYFQDKFFNIPVPKGFSLKNSFFRELEEVRDATLWTHEHSFERIVSVFRRMCVEVCDATTNETTMEPGMMKAYFGGDFEDPCAGFGAPNVVRFLESLENKNIWDNKD